MNLEPLYVASGELTGGTLYGAVSTTSLVAAFAVDGYVRLGESKRREERRRLAIEIAEMAQRTFLEIAIQRGEWSFESAPRHEIARLTQPRSVADRDPARWTSRVPLVVVPPWSGAWRPPTGRSVAVIRYGQDRLLLVSAKKVGMLDVLSTLEPQDA